MADAGGTAPGGSERSRDVVLLDRTNRLRLQLTGPKAAESLTGLVTSDVLALAPGQGQYSAALTPRGKVLADLRIFARSDHLLIDTGAASGPGLLAMIRKYVNPRLARHEDVSASLGDLGVFGPDAPALLRTVLGDVHRAGLADYSHVETRYSDAALMVARVPDYGVDGFDLIAPAPALETLRRDLEARVIGRTIVSCWVSEEAPRLVQVPGVARGRNGELLISYEVSVQTSIPRVGPEGNLANVAVRVNSETENIGARRLHTILEALLDDLAFGASELGDTAVTIDGALVKKTLDPIVSDADLAKYVL